MTFSESPVPISITPEQSLADVKVAIAEISMRHNLKPEHTRRLIEVAERMASMSSNTHDIARSVRRELTKFIAHPVPKRQVFADQANASRRVFKTTDGPRERRRKLEQSKKNGTLRFVK